MPRFTRAELEAEFARYVAINDDASRRRDWQAWADKFTPDVHYVEHAFGELHGREAVREWITKVMSPYPQMDFPMDWHVIDEERGWVVFQCQNRLAHPTDPQGEPFQFPTWSKIHYAGNGLWSYEEDNYNPAEAGRAIAAWREAGGRLLERQMKMK
jgi:ketosteroid isomerase-like protein